jgi:hypothetical protein
VTCLLLKKVIESYFSSAKDEKLFTIHKAGWVLEITPVDENFEPKNEMQMPLFVQKSNIPNTTAFGRQLGGLVYIKL